MPGPRGTNPGCGRPASARRETLCLLLGGRERSTEPLFLNGKQINRKIKLIGEALAPYALRKDNGVGIGEVSGSSSRTEGMSPGRPEAWFPHRASRPVSSRARAATDSREESADWHARRPCFLPPLVFSPPLRPSVRPSVHRSIHPKHSCTPGHLPIRASASS